MSYFYINFSHCPFMNKINREAMALSKRDDPLLENKVLG